MTYISNRSVSNTSIKHHSSKTSKHKSKASIKMRPLTLKVIEKAKLKFKNQTDQSTFVKIIDPVSDNLSWGDAFTLECRLVRLFGNMQRDELIPLLSQTEPLLKGIKSGSDRVRLFDFALSIDEQIRPTLFQQICPYIKEDSTVSSRECFIAFSSKFKSSKRNSLLKKLGFDLAEIGGGALAQHYIKQLLFTFSETHQKAFLKQMSLLFIGCPYLDLDITRDHEHYLHSLTWYDYYDERNIVNAISQIPPKKVIPFLRPIGGFFKSIDLGFERALFIQALLKVKEKEREAFIQLIGPYLKKGQFIHRIVDAFSKVPADQREPFIGQLAPFLKKAFHRDRIMEAFREIDEKIRPSFIRMITPLLRGMKNGCEIGQIIWATSAMSIAELKVLLDQVGGTISQYKNGTVRAALIDFFAKQAPKERSSLALMIPCFWDGGSSEDLNVALAAFKGIETTLRNVIIKKLGPSLKRLSNNRAIARVLGFLVAGKCQNYLLLSHLIPHLSEVTEEFQGVRLINIYAKVRKEDIPTMVHLAPYLSCVFDEDKVERCVSLFLKVKARHRLCVLAIVKSDILKMKKFHELKPTLKVVLKIEKRERRRFLNQIALLFKKIHIVSSRIKVAEKFLLFPPKSREKVVELLKDNLFYNYCDYKEALIYILSLTPPGYEEGVISLLNKQTARTIYYASLAAEHFSKDTKLRQTCLKYWTSQLEEESKKLNRSYVQHLSQFIMENVWMLGLFEKHPLVQLAIKYGTLSAPTKDPLNPFILYRSLLKKRREKICFDHLTLTTESQLQVNPAYFLKLQHCLPQPLEFKNMNHNSLEKMVDRLKKNAPKLGSMIREMTGFTFEKLEAGALGGDPPYLYTLLDTKENPLISAKFKCCVAYLQSLSTTPKEGTCEQEITLIKMLGSIQECKIGKDEGIRSYFTNVVSEKFKRMTGTDTKSKLLIHTLILRVIENQFSGKNAFIKQLVEENHVKQASHQEKYARSLIGDLVGLEKDVTFDPHSNTLYRSMVKKSRFQVLQIFYSHLTPSFLIKTIQTIINKDLKEPGGSKYFMGLNEILQNKGWNEETWADITQEGVVTLLEAVGAVTSSKK